MELPNLSALRITPAPIGGTFMTRNEEDVIKPHPWLVRARGDLETVPTVEDGVEVEGTGGNPVYTFINRWEVCHTNPKIGVAVSSNERGFGLYAAEDFEANEFVTFFTGRYMYEDDVDQLFPDEACVLQYNMQWDEFVVQASAADHRQPMYCRRLLCVPRMSTNKVSAINPKQGPSACNLQIGREGSLVDLGALFNDSKTSANCYADAICLRDDRFMEITFDRPAIAVYTKEAVARGSELTVTYGWDPETNDSDGGDDADDARPSDEPVAGPSDKNLGRTPSSATSSRPQTATPPPQKRRKRRKATRVGMPKKKNKTLRQQPVLMQGLNGRVPEGCIVNFGINIEALRRLGFKAEASLTYVRALETNGAKYVYFAARNTRLIDHLCGPPLVAVSVNSKQGAAYICFEPLITSERTKMITDEILEHDKSEEAQYFYWWSPIRSISSWWIERMYGWGSELPDETDLLIMGVSSTTVLDVLEYWKSRKANDEREEESDGEEMG